MELIEKRGSYYSYGDLRLGQGRENAKEYLRQNPELMEELETGIQVAAGIEAAPVNLDD
jgi:recombination protein RecA